ncbi:hypothetical protein ABC345_21030 [Shouchella sp. 1P09AA]|uniref:hypothetical protein n=1 Tax=unclassified Shouchella TaxID=2893065 RepID=UPI0039A2D947
MSVISPKERKQKKDIVKKMMETQGEKYNDWLHGKHQEYIDNNLIDYMNIQDEKEEDPSESKESSSSFVSSEEKGKYDHGKFSNQL